MSEKYYFMGYNYPIQDVKFLLEKICNFSDKLTPNEATVSQVIDTLARADSTLYAKFAKEMHKLRFSSHNK